jgi:hypothetical protein
MSYSAAIVNAIIYLVLFVWIARRLGGGLWHGARQFRIAFWGQFALIFGVCQAIMITFLSRLHARPGYAASGMVLGAVIGWTVSRSQISGWESQLERDGRILQKANRWLFLLFCLAVVAMSGPGTFAARNGIWRPGSSLWSLRVGDVVAFELFGWFVVNGVRVWSWARRKERELGHPLLVTVSAE